MEFNQTTNIFSHKNTFENVVCKMEAILSLPQCVKWSYCTAQVYLIQNAIKCSWKIEQTHTMWFQNSQNILNPLQMQCEHDWIAARIPLPVAIEVHPKCIPVCLRSIWEVLTAFRMSCHLDCTSKVIRMFWMLLEYYLNIWISIKHQIFQLPLEYTSNVTRSVHHPECSQNVLNICKTYGTA